MSAAAAAERPIHIIESGPAAGVVGGAELARRLGNLSLLTLRHGRHDGQGGARRRRPLPARELARGRRRHQRRGPAAERRRLSRACTRDRHRGGRRRRRQHRAPRRRRRVARRTRQRRRGPGSCVLRAWRHVAHGHRCQRDPRVHQSRRALAGGGLAIRRDLAERALQEYVAGPLRRIARGCGMGRAPRRECDDGARAARGVDRARPRPARSADAGLRRQRTRARVHARAPARHQASAGAARAGTCSARSACSFPKSSTTTCAPSSSASIASMPPRSRRCSARSRQKARTRSRQEGFDAHQRRFERLVDLRYTGANSELTLPFGSRRRRRLAARASSTPPTSGNTGIARTKRRSRS